MSGTGTGGNATPGLEGSPLPLLISDGHALVSVAAGAAGRFDLVPDSGADRLVLFAHGGRTPLVTPLEIVRLRAVSGHRIARRVLVQGLDFGRIRERDYEALLLEAAPGDRAMGDGLLPLHLFARVTFDGPGGRLVLEGRR